jgi:2-hydroxychromene-2-carboxylate isomerase
MRQRRKRRPRVYFSFRSPFSWMALTALERELPGFTGLVDMIPYWDPDEHTEAALRERDAEVHYAQMSKAKHLYILGDTKRTAAELGLRMAWPIDVDPWWEVPHLAWLAARREGRADAFYREVVTARWERGEDVCDQAVVAGLAARAGLDGARLATAVDDPEIRAEGVEALYSAYDEDVFGVPYFRVGRHRFWGYDRVRGFLAELRSTMDETGPDTTLAGVPEPVRAAAGAYDTDTAGGCG